LLSWREKKNVERREKKNLDGLDLAGKKKFEGLSRQPFLDFFKNFVPRSFNSKIKKKDSAHDRRVCLF